MMRLNRPTVDEQKVCIVYWELRSRRKREPPSSNIIMLCDVIWRLHSLCTENNIEDMNKCGTHFVIENLLSLENFVLALCTELF